MTPTIWIVDAAYLQSYSDGQIDYLKLKETLQDRVGAPFSESFYVNATRNPLSDAQDTFHTWLKTAPPQGPKMRVKLYDLGALPTTCTSCGHQGVISNTAEGVQVGIATLIVKLAAQWHYDRLVLSARDGALEEAIAYVKDELHKELWLSGFEGSVSSNLQMYADNVVWLDELWDHIRK
ncbi:MAG: NYN domain-containing protein [Gammaproteobacteria bacterium]